MSDDLAHLLGLLDSDELLGPPSGLGDALPAPLRGALLAGRFRVERVLGAGSMGTVLLAQDEELKRPATLKLIRGASDPKRVSRLRREATLAARVSHPHVVRVHGLEEESGQLFLVAEFVAEARTLDEAWRTLALDRRLDLLTQAAEGVGAAHEAGVVHRDVKPQNILVGADGRARVTDFGVARADDVERLTVTGAVVGTALYMAPEQTRGTKADARADVWALGVILYEALYDSLPFGGTGLWEVLAAIASEAPRKPSRKDESRALRRVWERALHKDPAQRYPDGAAFAAALRAARTGGPRLRGGMLLAGAGVVVILGVALWPSFTSPPAALAPAPTESGADEAPLSLPQRLRPKTRPLYLGLAGEDLYIETQDGLEVWDLRRERLRASWDGPWRLASRNQAHDEPGLDLIDPEGALVAAHPASPPRRGARSQALAERDARGAVYLREGRLELRERGREAQVLPLDPYEGRYRQLLLSGLHVVLVQGGQSNGGLIRLWSRGSGAPIPFEGGDEDFLTPRCGALSPDGLLLAVGCRNGTVALYRLDHPQEPPTFLSDSQVKSPSSKIRPLAHADTLHGVAFADSRSLLTSTLVDTALWDLERRELRERRPWPCQAFAVGQGRVAYAGTTEVLVTTWEGRLPQRVR